MESRAHRYGLRYVFLRAPLRPRFGMAAALPRHGDSPLRAGCCWGVTRSVGERKRTECGPIQWVCVHPHSVPGRFWQPAPGGVPRRVNANACFGGPFHAFAFTLLRGALGRGGPGGWGGRAGRAGGACRGRMRAGGARVRAGASAVAHENDRLHTPTPSIEVKPQLTRRDLLIEILGSHRRHAKRPHGSAELRVGNVRASAGASDRTGTVTATE